MINHPNRNKRIVSAVSARPSVRASSRARIVAHDHDRDWALIAGVIAQALRNYQGPLFCTDASGLNEIFLKNVGRERSVHDCHACRKFITNYGGLVTIAVDGRATPAFWHENTVPEFYRPAIAAMSKAVRKAKVTGVFMSSEKVLGTPKTGTWTHFAAANPSVYARAVLTAGQAMAAKREDHHTVARALATYTPAVLKEAERLLQAEHLPRPDRFLGPVSWLIDLHTQREAAKDSRLRDNVLWRAIATAPDGFCHPKASVIGPLLDDIADGVPFDEMKAKFTAMVHPLRYQRPQAAPAAANIAQAEKLVEQMGIRPALDRRFARLNECEIAWAPQPQNAPANAGDGVFAHLRPRGSALTPSVNAPPAVMTWDKFVRTVLPGAQAIEFYVTGGSQNFIALTSAQNADAPVIMKWGNNVAWYVYHGGTPGSQWGLARGWAKVNAIVPLPTMWGVPKPHLGEGFVLVLEGAVDSRTGQGNALFPECLIGDLHGVRATIEAYSRRAEMLGREHGSACGADVRKGAKMSHTLRVEAGGVKTEYQIDRWD